MKLFSPGAAQVPSELEPYMDDEFREVQLHWQDAYLRDVMPSPTELTPVDIGDQAVRIGVLEPVAEPDGSVVALAFPFNNGLGKSMELRSRFMHEAIMPQSQVLLFPNVHTGPNATYHFDRDDRRRLSEGSLAPLAEKYVRVIETLGVSRIALTGYSQGARTALEIAAVGSPSIEITHLNADEMPTKPGRGAKELQSDFMKSGGYGLQRKSMSESGFGALMEEIAGLELVLDYARFGVASLGRVSKLVHQGMVGSAAVPFTEALRHYDSLKVKIGAVEGSRLTDTADFVVPDDRQKSVMFETYTGRYANKHTTGDNYAAHALMVRAGLSR